MKPRPVVVVFFRKYFGPTQVAFSRLDETGQAALASDLESLWSSANAAQDPANHTLIHNELSAGHGLLVCRGFCDLLSLSYPP